MIFELPASSPIAELLTAAFSTISTAIRASSDDLPSNCEFPDLALLAIIPEFHGEKLVRLIFFVETVLSLEGIVPYQTVKSAGINWRKKNRRRMLRGLVRVQLN